LSGFKTYRICGTFCERLSQEGAMSQLLQVPVQSQIVVRGAPPSTRTRIATYLRSLPLARAGSVDATPPPRGSDLAAVVFAILTRNDFCGQNAAAVEPHRARATAQIEAAIRRGGPIELYLDFGSGYHTSVRPDVAPDAYALDFDAGFGEWLALNQIARLARQIEAIYAPGVRVTLLIDNLYAAAVDDIPIDQSAAYCRRLRELIAAAGLSDCVDLLVESEHHSAAEYALRVLRSRAGAPVPLLTADLHEEVQRNIGRICSAEEAAERAARYPLARLVSEQLLVAQIFGLRLAQQPSPAAPQFRLVPGAEGSLRGAHIALATAADGRIQPLALTRHTSAHFEQASFEFPELLPERACAVTFAAPIQPMRLQ
jgi:hypothetical protein